MAECADPGLIQYLDFEGKPVKDFSDPFSADELKNIYYLMSLSRTLDAKAANLVKQGKSYFYAMDSGHEAAQVGSIMALDSRDWIFPYHRSIAALIARGFTPLEFFSEVMGKTGAINKGRQMPNHFGKKALKLVTPSSVVGNQIPEAVGTALAAKRRGDNTVSIVYFGEGAASQGDFHVGMNMAGVYKTPTIFFCENNQYAISVPMNIQAAAEAVSIEACGYEFPGFRVDGNDFFAVYFTTRQMVDRARSGAGPSLIEALTYRFGSHSSSDDASRYRNKGEEEDWHRRDPIKRMLGYLKHKGYYSEQWFKETEERIKQEADSALREASDQKIPAPETMFDDVFADMPWHLKKQRDQMLELLEKYPPTQH